MAVMEKLKMFVVQEPVVAASCLMAGVVLDFSGCERSVEPSGAESGARFGRLLLPAVVRPILDSMESSKQVPQPPISDVVAGMTGKKQA